MSKANHAKLLIEKLEKLTGKKIQLNENIELPSHKQIGDKTSLNFGSAGTLTDCRIAAVHFDEGKVNYDVEVAINVQNGEIEDATIIYNVDSIVVNDNLSASQPPLEEDIDGATEADSINEGTWALPEGKKFQQGQLILKQLEAISRKAYNVFGDDEFMDGIQSAFSRGKALLDLQKETGTGN